MLCGAHKNGMHCRRPTNTDCKEEETQSRNAMNEKQKTDYKEIEIQKLDFKKEDTGKRIVRNAMDETIASNVIHEKEVHGRRHT